LYYHSRKGLLSKLRYGFLDPSQIRGDEITTGFGSLMGFESGIERGEFGEEKAYKIWTRNHKTKEFKSVTIPRFGLRSGRTFMLHGFVPDYPGQGRGISRLAHAIQDFANLTDFSCAQIMKAINQSSIMMYVKPSKDAPAANPLEGLMTRRGAGPARQTDFESVEGAENSTTTPNSGRPVNFQELPEATFTDPGSVGIFSAQAGEDVLPFKETAPSPNFDDFMLSFTSYLSASMSMPIEVVLMKFGENYSASRAALLLFWRVAVRWRKEMESDFLNPMLQCLILTQKERPTQTGYMLSWGRRIWIEWPEI
jgi:capsid protein